ncbi:MAG: hypothetical protein H0V47_05745 [Chloroflexia bacterium]|nr:hypothetical protein [Chloroflexia bacterium]
MREMETAIQQRISGRAYRRALSDPTARSFVASYGLDRVAAWTASVAIVTLSYRLTEDVGIVALFVLTQVLARLFVGPVGASFFQQGKWTLAIASVTRIAAAGSLVFVSSRGDLGWALVSIGLMSGASVVIEGAQSQLIPAVASGRGLPVFNRLIGRVEQLSAVVGAVIAGLILFAAAEGAAFAGATLLFAGSMTVLHRRNWLTGSKKQPLLAPMGASLERMLHHPVLRLVAVGIIAVAALGAVIRVTLIDVVIDHLEYASGHYGLLLGLVGLGALIGPLPIHKLLGRIGIGFVVTGSVIMLALGMVVLGLANHVAIMIPILLASGVLIVTCDLVAAVTLRRLIPEDDLDGTTRVTMGAVLGGQLLGLVAVLGLSQLWSSSVVVTLVGTSWAIVLLVLFLSSNGPRLALAASTPSTRQPSPKNGDAE